MVVCTHQCSQFELAAQCSEPLVTTVWIQVITCPSLLPCTLSESSSLSSRRNCPLLLCFCWGSTSAGAVGSIQRARGSECWALLFSHWVVLERITAGRTAGESHVNLYPCAALQLSCCISFALNLSKKRSHSCFVIMPSGIPACLNVSVLLIFIPEFPQEE